MTVTIVAAPPAAGKTKASIDLIQQTLAAKPFARVWVIVPGLLPGAHYKRRLAAAGGAIGVHVGSFQKLSTELLERHNASLPSAPTPFGNILLRQAVNEAWDAGQLQHFGSIREFPGFISVLRDTFRELKFGFVEPAQFTHAAAAQGAGMDELALLYTTYTDKMRRLGWDDPSDPPRRLHMQLAEHPEWLREIDLVVVDGFDSFTGAEIALMQTLAAGVGLSLIHI